MLEMALDKNHEAMRKKQLIKNCMNFDCYFVCVPLGVYPTDGIDTKKRLAVK